MAHAIWNGSISFGLVSIPVKLFSAIKHEEEIHFHLLHDKDQGRIRNVRKCETCGKEIPWEHVEKGWEYQKGSYVVMGDEELDKMKPEATQSVDISLFVDAGEIDSMLYDTSYYAEPEKKGAHAYALLREALRKSGKVGIAQVVLRTRQHLAAVKPVGNVLVVELMHFGNEIVDPDEFKLPAAKEKLSEQELKMAHMLIDNMTAKFAADSFADHYQAQLRDALEARAKHRAVPEAPAKPRAQTNVVDLLEVLKESLKSAKVEEKERGGKQGGRGRGKPRGQAKSPQGRSLGSKSTPHKKTGS